MKLHLSERPADAVVFQVGRDDVIAIGKDSLERHVQRVRAVEGEDESLRPVAVKELIEQMPAVVERALGRQSHLVPRPSRIGEIIPRKAIERLIDRLRLGETRGGVVEVDHAAGSDFCPLPSKFGGNPGSIRTKETSTRRSETLTLNKTRSVGML